MSGRIPNSVEWEIEELLEQYQDNITSILGQFPALQVCTVGVGLHCRGGAALGVGLHCGSGAALGMGLHWGVGLHCECLVCCSYTCVTVFTYVCII